MCCRHRICKVGTTSLINLFLLCQRRAREHNSICFVRLKSVFSFKKIEFYELWVGWLPTWQILIRKKWSIQFQDHRSEHLTEFHLLLIIEPICYASVQLVIIFCSHNCLVWWIKCIRKSCRPHSTVLGLYMYENVRWRVHAE